MKYSNICLLYNNILGLVLDIVSWLRYLDILVLIYFLLGNVSLVSVMRFAINETLQLAQSVTNSVDSNLMRFIS